MHEGKFRIGLQDASIQSEEELVEKVLEEPKTQSSWQKKYCDYLGLDLDRFNSEVSFSFWEFIEGYNRIVVADSAVTGRYHVMTKGPSALSYAIVEDGAVVKEFAYDLPAELTKGLPALIKTYEQVRNLGNFDPNHCPIMEIKTVCDENYFLQYHRTRDFEPTQFKLERELESGEIEAQFVRGATPPEGVTHKVIIYKGDGEMHLETWQAGRLVLSKAFAGIDGGRRTRRAGGSG